MKMLQTSSPQTLQKRAKEAARRMFMKKFLQGKSKHDLSAQERDRLEQRISGMLKMQPAVVTKMIQKVKGLERSRISSRGKKK
jgi:hypothetical protein